MKKIALRMVLACLLSCCGSMVLSAQNVTDKYAPIQYAGDTIIVCTKTFGKSIRGYISDTPVKIYLKGDKVVKVEAMSNRETRSYFAVVKQQLMDKWNGLTAKEAHSQKVDVITGSTTSSRAIIETVQRGLEYYLINAGK